jgi:hypothetical protein
MFHLTILPPLVRICLLFLPLPVTARRNAFQNVLHARIAFLLLIMCLLSSPSVRNLTFLIRPSILLLHRLNRPLTNLHLDARSMIIDNNHRPLQIILNDHAIAIAEGVLTISPGYSVRIMGSSPDVVQIYHRDFPQWNSKHISSIHGDDDFLFRKRDLLHSNDSQETYLTSGQYDMKGPSNFWYSFRDLSAYPPFSS